MNNKRIVKIKTWEQMEEEFGSDEESKIYINDFFFHKGIEEKIPKNRIIALDDYNMWKKYGISEGMIEEELNPKDYPQYLI